MITSGNYIPSSDWTYGQQVDLAAAECLLKIALNYECASPANIAAICFRTSPGLDDYSNMDFNYAQDLAKTTRANIERSINNDENIADDNINQLPEIVSTPKILKAGLNHLNLNPVTSHLSWSPAATAVPLVTTTTATVTSKCCRPHQRPSAGGCTKPFQTRPASLLNVVLRSKQIFMRRFIQLIFFEPYVPSPRPLSPPSIPRSSTCTDVITAPISRSRTGTTTQDMESKKQGNWEKRDAPNAAFGHGMRLAGPCAGRHYCFFVSSFISFSV